MIVSLIAAAAIGGFTPGFNGADLNCVAGGAQLKLWQGSEAAPTRVLTASAGRSSTFEVDIAHWQAVATPSAVDDHAYGLEISEARDGSQHLMRTVISCAKPGGPPLRLRFSSGGDPAVVPAPAG
ncbi:MAG TPA: hypothetical protein VIJ94_01500 [Caulobacteraceae bacterium]